MGPLEFAIAGAAMGAVIDRMFLNGKSLAGTALMSFICAIVFPIAGKLCGLY